MTTQPPLMQMLCAICWASDSEEPDQDAWAFVDLAESIAWSTTLVPLGMFTTEAGRYRVCPVCAPWLPVARTAPLPAPVAELIGALAGKVTNLAIRRTLVSDLTGAFRHLGRQLTLAHAGSGG